MMHLDSRIMQNDSLDPEPFCRNLLDSMDINSDVLGL